MSKRSRVLGFGSALLLVAAGVAGALSVSGTVGQVLALVLIGLGFVLATALVFLEVGLSEDRERAAASDQDDKATESPNEPGRVKRRRDRRLTPRRMDRMRGTRRRLR